MRLPIGGLLRPLLSQDRAVDNARQASTVLARAAVEREEVLMYLDALERRREAHSA